jgi:D-alanyl-D-alanine carboxypeptidase/D-alanyl-D-alanine-endopeptidase (penicillin-binding protein 4)
MKNTWAGPWIAIVLTWLFNATLLPAQKDFAKTKHLILEHKSVSYGQISWSFRDMQTGEELDAWQSQKLLIPASAQKAITTALVLDSLGPSYRFETQVGIMERTNEGQREYFLVIKGSGDPSLGSGIAGALTADSILNQISGALIEKEIREIKGGIIICTAQDTSGYQSVPRSWTWEDIGNYYGAGSHGLNWRGNSFIVETPEKQKGDTLISKIKVSDYVTDMRIVNNIQHNANQNSEINIFGNPLSNTVIIDGELTTKNSAFSERGAIPNPPLVFGEELKNHLIKNGIHCNDKISIIEAFQDTFQTLISILSPNLEQLVNETNQNSNNLFAESLGRTIGYGPYHLKSRNILDQKAIRYSGITDVPINFADASGLSRKNCLNTAFLSQFLYNSGKKPWFDSYKMSLPLAGMEGTMKKFKKIENLRAKTGSLERVKSYCGYMTDKSGRHLSFALIFNNVPLTGNEQKEMAEKLLEAASKHTF